MQIVITGTDTGVGKTLVSALCLAHLLGKGAKVRALKPFCSGDRTDALLFWELQERRLTLEEVNPFYFETPISPFTAARLAGRSISLEQTLAAIRQRASECDVLLIEGAGGLLSPLGEMFTVRDVIAELDARVIVVAANRLGMLNHTLLTFEALASRLARRPALVVTETSARELSAGTNLEDLARLMPAVRPMVVPHFPEYRADAEFIRSAAEQLAAPLAQLLQNL